jgi:outer membrane protein assembly factor BamB
MRRRLAQAAVAAGLTLATAGCWPVPGQNADRTSYNGLERAITAENVGELTEVWRAQGTFGSAPRATVTSPGGAHTVTSCVVWTVDPATGARRWEESVDIETCGFAGVGTPTYGDPYVVDTEDGPAVVAGFGVSAVRAPGVEEGNWVTTARDPTDGSFLGRVDVGVAVAARDGVVAGREDVMGAPGWSAQRLALAPADGGPRTATWTIGAEVASGGLAPGGVTLRPDQVVHAGQGTLRTNAGAYVAGLGLRAYDRTAAPTGCGAIGGVAVSCPAWTLPTDGDPTAPVVGGGGIFTRTDAGTLYAANAATGASLWTATGLGDAGAPAFAADGGLWVPTGDGRIAIFDASGCGTATCAPLTTFDTGRDGPVSTPAVTDEVVVVSAGGDLVALPQDGCGTPMCTPSWTAPGEGAPIITGGRVLTSVGAQVVAYGSAR